MDQPASKSSPRVLLPCCFVSGKYKQGELLPQGLHRCLLRENTALDICNPNHRGLKMAHNKTD